MNCTTAKKKQHVVAYVIPRDADPRDHCDEDERNQGDEQEEPWRALYHTRDLHDDSDEQWLSPYPDPTNWSEHHVLIGRARTYGDGTDLTIVTYGNGLHMSRRVARRLDRAQISTRIVDMRWLAPLPIQDFVREANATGRILVVDETRSSGGVAEGVVTALVDEGFTGPRARVASFIPLGDAALEVLLSEATIEAAAMKLTQVSR